MEIADGKVALFHYTLTNDQGEVLDTSSGGNPLGYVHGTGTIIPGLEEAMTGKTAGDSFKVSIEPKDAYGQHNQALVQRVPRELFSPDEEIRQGMQFQAETDAGGQQIVTILEIGESGFTGYRLITDACVESIVFSFNRIAHYMEEGFHIGVFFEVTEQFQ